MERSATGIPCVEQAAAFALKLQTSRDPIIGLKPSVPRLRKTKLGWQRLLPTSHMCHLVAFEPMVCAKEVGLLEPAGFDLATLLQEHRLLKAQDVAQLPTACLP